ncbi:MAG TPA: PIN domain-containing protein [Thermoanaerobaculia bacterium]
MIFVDTSVWVAALRAGEGREADHLRQLLDTHEVALAIVVKLEILSGASRHDRPRLKRTLSALPTFFPSGATWPIIEGWLELASNGGQKFGIADLLIGALAAETRSTLWSLDSDFERLADLGVVRLHRPR